MRGEPGAILTAVIILPDGGSMGGVTTWARTVAQAGKIAGFRVICIGPGVARFDCCETIDSDGGTLAEAVGRAISEAGDGPVVLLPQLHASAYAAACVAAHESGHPHLCAAGWMHTDIAYDRELLRRFAPALSGIVCVSDSARNAISELPAVVLPTGVPFDADAAFGAGGAHDPVRLLYVGRLDAYQKRCGCLIPILRHLNERGQPATLTIAGDGPMRDVLEAEAAHESGVRMLGAVPSERLAEVYASHDLLLLPSRSEGLGLARIEAAWHGCVPMVTPGGSAFGIEPARTGIVVDCHPDAGDAEVAERFTDAIAGLLEGDIAPVRAAARWSVGERFGMDRFATEVAGLLSGWTASEANRAVWRAVAADPMGAERITVPGNAADRIWAFAELVGDRPVALHGAGAHTVAVWDALMRSGVRVVAVCDDDPQRWGESVCGVPVIDPVCAHTSGASDVLISSWLHEGAVWARRDVYKRQGLAVHRLYGAGAVQVVG